MPGLAILFTFWHESLYWVQRTTTCRRLGSSTRSPMAANIPIRFCRPPYPSMQNQLGYYRQNVPGEALIAIDLGIGINAAALGPPGQSMYVRPSSGYPWTFGNASSLSPYLPQGQPDLWIIGAYNPNAVDFSNALAQLEGSGVPASKIMVSEFATSSSIASNWDSTYLSYLFMTYGDDTTPTGDQSFQAAWTGPRSVRSPKTV